MRWIKFGPNGDPLPGSYSTVQDGPGVWVEDGEVPAPPVVPQSVTAAQGGIALIQAGLMGAVQAAVDAPDTPEHVKWAWARAANWERGSAALAYLADKAGISPQQMDDLFTAAPSIVA